MSDRYERQAEAERASGIPDREPYCDQRDVLPLDLRSYGYGKLQIEPRLGYTSCRLRDQETGEVLMVGTLKQVFRFLSRQVPHMLGPRSLQ